jgi:hypothetical protein
MDTNFPFIPKSNSKLRRGHFWAIQLSNRNFGCGIVLDVPIDIKTYGTKSFYLGLLNWTDNIKPTAESLENQKLTILAEGHAHIKTIATQGEEIIGIIDLEKNNLQCSLVVDSQEYSNSSYVLKGFQTVSKATRQDHENLKTKSTWGYEVIIAKANKLLTK